MPKKGRGKEGPPPKGGKKGGAEAMPQVWLPDQPNPELHMDLSDSFPDLSHNEEGPPPTDEEQQQMALLWAKEEAQAPRGWDEDQELDYSEVVRKREEREREEREKEETPDLFKYSQSSVFSVKALGFVSGAVRAESQTSTLETIDTAQKQGRLPWVTSDKDQRMFSISKYGIKVTDSQRQCVFARHPLHRIVNITYYEDTYKKHMLAVRVSGAEDGQQELHIYESESEAQAKDVCLTLAQAFEAVYNKLQLEQNLHSSDLR